MGDNKVTIQDIADRAGVSKSTVSRYLNRGYVSAEKAERIRAVIDEIGTRLETQVFVVREDDTLVKDISEILPHPIVFVLQGRGIVPCGCGEDIAVVFVFQHIHSIYGSRHWLHQWRNDPRGDR